MQNKQQVYLYIKDEIERVASLEEQQILNEAKQIEEEAYNQMKREAQDDAMHQLNKELAAISSDASIESAKQLELRTKKLVEKRQGYVDEIFNEVKNKLIAFSESDEYKDYLVKHVHDVASNYKMDHCVLYLSSKDMKYSDVLKEAYGYELEVEERDINIGGFIIENKESHIVVDETLETVLNEQKEWFVKTSQLMIK